MNRDHGIIWCIGAPGSGKTFRALRLAESASDVLKRDVLVIDPVGTIRPNDIKLTGGRKCHLKHVGHDLEAALPMITAAQNAIVVVDEAHLLFSAGKRTSTHPVLVAMRTWRHRSIRLILTSQHVSGDVPQAAWACDPGLCVFRTTSRRSLELLEREFDLDPDAVRALPDRAYHFVG